MELFHQETASGGWVANLVPEVRGGENVVLKISLPSFGKMVFKQLTSEGGGRKEMRTTSTASRRGQQR